MQKAGELARPWETPRSTGKETAGASFTIEGERIFRHSERVPGSGMVSWRKRTRRLLYTESKAFLKSMNRGVLVCCL